MSVDWRPHPPLPAAEHILPRENGYGVHEVAAVTLGECTGRVWRHVHRDPDGTRFEFDATIDGLVDASSSGLGESPQRLRELASVASATTDELGEARARQRHPAGSGLTSALTAATEEALPSNIGQGLCHGFVTRTSRVRFPTHP